MSQEALNKAVREARRQRRLGTLAINIQVTCSYCGRTDASQCHSIAQATAWLKRQPALHKKMHDYMDQDLPTDLRGEGSWSGAYFTDGLGEEHHVANMEPGNSDY